MTQLPLFPLGAVLLPGGRMPLRVFEPRYVDLIGDCMKQGTEFGVIWIREGSEVVSAPESAMPRLAQLGTAARIVDWDSLPGGLLGVTIEGTRKFRLLSTTQQANFLVVGEVDWLPVEPSVELPDYAVDLQQVLKQLLLHPQIAALNMAVDPLDTGLLTHLLAQLLPIPQAQKFGLLAESDPLRRLDQLLALLDRFSE
jgi:Lon protease-like protein